MYIFQMFEIKFYLTDIVKATYSNFRIYSTCMSIPCYILIIPNLLWEENTNLIFKN